MSLIGDALRRKQEDKPAPAPAPEPPVSSAPPAVTLTIEKPRPTLSLRGRAQAEEPAPSDTQEPVPEKKPSKKHHKRMRAWVELLIVITGLALLIALGITLYFMYFSPPEKPAAAPAAPAEKAPQQQQQQQPEPPSPPQEKVVSESAPVATETPPKVMEDVAVVAAPAPGPEVLAPATPVEKQPEPEAPTPTPPEPEVKPMPVIWPTFSLQAAMGGGQRGSVMINGQIFQIGSTFGEVTILEITPQGVLMEYEGERRTFRVRR